MIEIVPNWHPAFVHFPIAFTTAALAFTAIGTLFRNWSYAAQCRMTGRWMLWGAALFALIAAAFGWFAFNSVAHDEVSHAAMILHRNWALGALTALFALAAWDVWRGRFRKMPSKGFLGLLGVAWLLRQVRHGTVPSWCTAMGWVSWLCRMPMPGKTWRRTMRTGMSTITHIRFCCCH